MTFGFSRDDAGKFLDAYYDNKIYESDPFVHIDVDGVGRLVAVSYTHLEDEGGIAALPRPCVQNQRKTVRETAPGYTNIGLTGLSS